MRCQLCGKDIPEGKSLCDECEKRRQEYLSTKTVSNNNDKQPEIVRPTDVLVTEVKVKSVEQKVEEKKETVIKLSYQEKLRLLWMGVIVYTIIYSLFAVALFFPGLSEYFPEIIFEIYSLLGTASLAIMVIISFVVCIKIFFKIRTIIKEDFVEYKKINLLFYIIVIAILLCSIVNDIASSITAGTLYSVVGSLLIFNLNALLLTISATLVFGLERKYKYDLKDSSNKRNFLILLIIILLIIYLIIYNLL